MMQSNAMGLVNIFIRPSVLFNELSVKPGWFLPVIAASLIRLFRVLVFYQPSHEPTKLVVTFLLEGLTFILPVLLCSILFLLGLYLLGAETTYIRVFAVLAHTFFCYTAITIILSLIVYGLISDKDSMNMMNPVFSNLGVLIDHRQHLALNFFVSSLDVISFYHIYLIALGLSITSKKIIFKHALLLTISIWATYVCMLTGIKWFAS